MGDLTKAIVLPFAVVGTLLIVGFVGNLVASEASQETAATTTTTTEPEPRCDNVFRVGNIVRRHLDDIDGSITLYNASPSNEMAALMAFNVRQSGDAARAELRSIGGPAATAAIVSLPEVTDAAIDMLLAAPEGDGSADALNAVRNAPFDEVSEWCDL